MGHQTVGSGALKIHDQRSSDHSSKALPIVYFDLVTFPELDRPPVIKIGETGNHAKRRKDHAKSKFGIKFEVEPLCMVRGTRSDEKAIHRYFEAHKVDGEEETFAPHEEVVDYIRWLRDQYFTWVPDCKQCPSLETLDVVDQALWMPNPHRRKKAPAQPSLLDDFGCLNLPPREVTVDDFYTNEIIIKAAREVMGGIDVDPASHPIANQVVKAEQFFTIHDNGLAQHWRGRVWVNPPFSQWQSWVPKIVNEWNSGRVECMCILCATRTLTAQYFTQMHKAATAICVLAGRIRFWGGRAGDSPDDGHVVFYFGDDVKKFADVFNEIGTVAIYANGGKP